MTEAASTELRPPLRVKLFYALGQAPQSGGFDTALPFSFFFYTVVLGLSGAWVGAALAISLVVDAIADPLIGSLSDATRSRLGRRLPAMLLAIPLMAISLAILFAPPAGAAPVLLCAWLAAASIAVRGFISLFNVPYIALGAELAEGYRERSSVVAWRALAGILAAVLVNVVAYNVFFVGKAGLQRAAAYSGFGLAVATLLVVAPAICCLGVWRYARALPRPAAETAPLLRRLGPEVAEIFRNRSFRTLFVSATILYVAVGVNATLNNHAWVFVWRLKAQTIQFIGYAYLAGILAGVPIAPLLQRWFEKKAIIIAGVGMLVLSWVVLPGLRAAGLFHPVGEAALGPLMFNVAFAGVGVGLAVIAYPSMMADAADEHELLFGRRREGLYFAGLGFAAKAATGLGVLVGGLALAAIGFPRLAPPPGTLLPEAVLARLTLAWGPASAVFVIVSLVVFLPYAITRARHDEISVALRTRRGSE